MVQQLFSSRNLRQWEYLGPLVEGPPYTEPGEDGAVPYFWPIGDKHILRLRQPQARLAVPAGRLRQDKSQVPAVRSRPVQFRHDRTGRRPRSVRHS